MEVIEGHESLRTVAFNSICEEHTFLNSSILKLLVCHLIFELCWALRYFIWTSSNKTTSYSKSFKSSHWTCFHVLNIWNGNKRADKCFGKMVVIDHTDNFLLFLKRTVIFYLTLSYQIFGFGFTVMISCNQWICVKFYAGVYLVVHSCTAVNHLFRLLPAILYLNLKWSISF